MILQELFNTADIQIREESNTVGYPASEVMDRIERGSRLAVYQGLQSMSYEGIGPTHQRDVLEPYAREISEYLNNSLAEWPNDKSVIAQVLRLLNIGAKWPELRNCINKNKDSIVRYILTRVKENITDTSWDKRQVINNILDGLSDININWPELEVIRQSLNNKLKEDSTRVKFTAQNVQSLSRELLAAIQEHDKERAGKIFLGMSRFWVMLQSLLFVYMHDKQNVKWFFDTQKSVIMKYILEEIKETGDISELEEELKVLRKAKVDWPELDIVQKSLNADKKIDEDLAADDENDDQIMRDFVLGSVKTNLKSGNIGAALNVIQADLKIADMNPEAKIAWFKQHVSPLLNRNKPKILKWFATSIDAVTIPRIVSAYKLLNVLDIKIPDLLNLLNSQKDHVVKRLLQVVKNHASTDPVIKDIQLLKELGVKWPELDVIQRSSEAKPVVNEDRQQGYYLERMLDDVDLHLSNNDVSTAMHWVRHYYVDRGDVSVLLPYLEKYKDRILKYISKTFNAGQFVYAQDAIIILNKMNVPWPELDTIYEDNKDIIIKKVLWTIRHRLPVDAKNMVAKLRGQTIDWPELDIIERSLNAGK